MRRWNWVQGLSRAIEDASAHPFDYGTFNCGLFAAACVDGTVEGSTWSAQLRECFNDEDSANAWLAAQGGIEAAVTARLGEPITWPRAQRGDVCLLDTPLGLGLGVCVGSMIAVMGTGGIGYLKLDKAIKAWRVN